MEMEPSGSLETMAEECFRELPSRSLYLPAPIPSSPSPWTTLSPRAFKWLEELYKTGWNNSPSAREDLVSTCHPHNAGEV